MLVDHCLVWPVCNVGVLWPNGWIKMPLGTEVELSQATLDGEPSSPCPAERCTAPPTFAVYVSMSPGALQIGLLWTQPVSVNCGPCLLWPNGWIKMPPGTLLTQVQSV